MLARALKARGCDWIDVSSGGVSPRQKIKPGPGYQVPFAEIVRNEVGLATMAVGLITEPRQAEAIVAEGRADLVALARGMLFDPRWPWRAAVELGGVRRRPAPVLARPAARGGRNLRPSDLWPALRPSQRCGDYNRRHGTSAPGGHMNALSLVTPKADAAGPIASVPEIVDELRQGNIVVLVDDEDRENEGDLVFAADFVTPEKINFMAKHARGLVCLTLTEAHARQLALPPMARANGTVHGTNFTVSIEAAEGVTTGISAADRARTVWVATRPTAKASDIVQPGHIFPGRGAGGRGADARRPHGSRL